MWARGKDNLRACQELENNAVTEPRRLLELTQDQDFSLYVVVARFMATPEDVTGYAWQDSEGNGRLLEMPPYYICDMPQALNNIQVYAQMAKSNYVNYLLAGANPIIRKTFEAALSHVAVSQVREPGTTSDMSCC